MRGLVSFLSGDIIWIKIEFRDRLCSLYSLYERLEYLGSTLCKEITKKSYCIVIIMVKVSLKFRNRTQEIYERCSSNVVLFSNVYLVKIKGLLKYFCSVLVLKT